MPKKLLMHSENSNSNNGSDSNWSVIVEDFEDTVFNLNITGTWERYRPTDGELNNKTWVYKSKKIYDNQESSFSFDIKPMAYNSCLLCFSYDISSEDYDILYLYENEEIVGEFANSDGGYHYYQIKNPAKTNKIKFSYKKDFSNAEGRDNAYIGEIKILYYNKENTFVPKESITPSWTNTILSNPNWLIQNGYIKSPIIYDNKDTTTRIAVQSTAKNTHFLRITYSVSSEKGYDYGYCHIWNNPGQLLFKESGEVSRNLVVPISDVLFLEFGYKKDTGGSQGEDCLKIHKIELGNVE